MAPAKFLALPLLRCSSDSYSSNQVHASDTDIPSDLPIEEEEQPLSKLFWHALLVQNRGKKCKLPYRHFVHRTADVLLEDLA